MCHLLLFLIYFQCDDSKKATRRLFCIDFRNKYISCSDYSININVCCDYEAKFEFTHSIWIICIFVFCVGNYSRFDWCLQIFLNNFWLITIIASKLSIIMNAGCHSFEYRDFLFFQRFNIFTLKSNLIENVNVQIK